MEKILLVEDDAQDFARVQRLLLGRYALDRTSTLEETGAYLDRCFRENAPLPKLILLDLRLSDSTGFDTFVAVQLHAQNQLPIVILTAIEDRVLAKKCVASGAQDYLTKGRDLLAGLAEADDFFSESARDRLLSSIDFAGERFKLLQAARNFYRTMQEHLNVSETEES